jgi:hypothetical protein
MFYTILLISSQNERRFRQKLQRKSKQVLYVQQFFFKKIVPFMRWCVKYSAVGQATEDNMAHAHCMPDT